MSSPNIQGGWGWEFGPLALREELGDAECLHGSLQTPPILKDPLFLVSHREQGSSGASCGGS